jgi:hypothetical protein
MPKDIVPTIEGEILGVLPSVMDEVVPENIMEHEGQWTEGMNGHMSRTHVAHAACMICLAEKQSVDGIHNRQLHGCLENNHMSLIKRIPL